MDQQRFPVTAPLRLLLGAALCLGGTASLAFGHGIDWGVGWTTWVPALAVMLVGAGLAGRRELRRTPGGLEIHVGWLWRRCLTLRDAGDYALVPTAGLWAVVARIPRSTASADADGQPFIDLPLATWLGRRRAESLGAWLERQPGWRRVQIAAPVGDR